MRAYCLIKPTPHYRHEAFVAGLAACGYRVANGYPAKAEPGDVLVIWNRYGTHELVADKFEAEGGTVLVAENGYLGRDAAGRQHYAIAQHGHNGSGRWPRGAAARWKALGIELKAWRARGEHVLICPNRHFGMRGFEMPTHWVNETLAEVRKYTKRPVRVRPHPGNWQASQPLTPLAEDLANAWAVVIWASSAGVHALAAGIPVFCTAPWWICKAAANDSLSRLEDPLLPERLPAFERLAWGQWNVEEIASGLAFRHLLSADVCTA